MRKFVLTIAAVFMAVFCFIPNAFAEEYAELGRFMTGQDVNTFVAAVDIDAVIDSRDLPSGCYIQEESFTDTQKKLMLRGRFSYAGEFNFIVSVSSETDYDIICRLYVDPVPPLVQTGPNVDCSQGSNAKLHVSASVNDGGALGYQWYAGLGLESAVIIGETESEYYPDTSRTGSYYYYCVVTNTNGGISSTSSEPIRLTVTNPVVSSIIVSSMPTKLKYNVGESLNLNGLAVKVTMDNGQSSLISGGFTVEPGIFDKVGTQTVKLSYGGKSCNFSVEVVNKDAELKGIGVVTMPAKTKYKVGERLETQGLSIRAYTADGQFDVNEGLECSPMLLTKEGSQTITVSYGGKTCTFNVTVEEEKEVIRSVSVATRPTKVEYTVGDMLDTAGLTIRVISNKKTEDLSSGFSCTPKLLTTAGVQTISVIYGQYSCSFEVNVKAKAEATATPAPTNTPMPGASPTPSGLNIPGQTAPEASANPTETPQISPSHSSRDKSKKDDPSTALVKFGLIVAITALVGIAGCVYILNHKDIDMSKIFKGKDRGDRQ